MYTPENGSIVYWVWQNGDPAAETKFTNTGTMTSWTGEHILARYGDPITALNSDFAKANFSAEQLESIRQDHTRLYGVLRFHFDPAKPNLQGFIRTAAERGNPFGIESETLSPQAYNQQAMDIAATLMPQGENTPLFRQFAVEGEVGGFPIHPGDSTDPSRRTERRILGPHGNFERKGPDGKTYYYFNPRTDKPSDPWSQVTTTTPPVSTSPTTTSNPSNPSTSPLDSNHLSKLKSAASSVKEALPSEGKGGAPLQKLAAEVKKLLAVIDGLGL